MERTYAKDVKPGKVKVAGWVERIRDLGGLKFFILRDRSGKVQVTVKKGHVDESVERAVDDLHREDCIIVYGEAIKCKQAPGGIEIIPERIEILSKAEPIPIEIGRTGKGKRFDWRFLDLRRNEIQNIFRFRSEVIAAAREFFSKSGFIEVQTPVIQAAGAEGGAEMFPLIYYNKSAFLRQSPQLYKQILMASGFDRVFEIGPAFRAEAFHTRRHVSEFLSIDAELAWIESEEDVMRVAEQLIRFVYKKTSKTLKELGIEFKVPKLPFKRITYDEAIEMLKGSVKWGEDLGEDEERILGQRLAEQGIEWYFITKFPSQIKPFYIMMDGKYSRGFDLGFKGLEIASGGQREHRYDQLVKIMRAKGLDPAKFEFYLQAFKYGMPPHGGFGLGADRLVEKMLGLNDIKEVILFPRTPEMLVP